MRSVVHTRTGSPADVVEVIARPEPPALRDNHLLVRMHLVPLHPGDLLLGDPAPGRSFLPRTIGSEGVGVVQEVGKSVRDFSPGDRVAIFPAPEALSELVTTDAANAVHVPFDVDDEVASLMLVNSITAREVLRAAGLLGARPSHQTGPLVVAAAASSVGKLIIANAARDGLDVIAVVRSQSSEEDLNTLFPNLPVVRTENREWKDRLTALLGGRPLPVAIDAHGGPFTRDLLAMVEPGGTVFVFGDLSRTDTGILAFDVVTREVGLRGVSIGRWFTRDDATRRSDRAAALDSARAWPHLFKSAGTFAVDDVLGAVEAAQRPGKRGTPLVLMSSGATEVPGV